MLDVRSISRHYGDLKAVDEVSFAIGSGEIVGLNNLAFSYVAVITFTN